MLLIPQVSRSKNGWSWRSKKRILRSFTETDRSKIRWSSNRKLMKKQTYWTDWSKTMNWLRRKTNSLKNKIKNMLMNLKPTSRTIDSQSTTRRWLLSVLSLLSPRISMTVSSRQKVQPWTLLKAKVVKAMLIFRPNKKTSQALLVHHNFQGQISWCLSASHSSNDIITILTLWINII